MFLKMRILFIWGEEKTAPENRIRRDDTLFVSDEGENSVIS